MQSQFGVGFIPYEIGDKVQLKGSVFTCIIEDIRMIQYIKDKRIEFEILDSISNTWVRSIEIEKRII